MHRIGDQFVVNCQSDLLDSYSTRFVIPLGPAALEKLSSRRLNPIFHHDGQALVLLTHFATTVPRSELGPALTSLAHRSFEITDAIDVLLSGV